MLHAALYAITGTAVLWLLQSYGKTWLRCLKARISLLLPNTKRIFPEYTFSSSRPILPGQVTTVEYDSSAGPTAGKQPHMAATILREFQPTHTASPDASSRRRPLDKGRSYNISEPSSEDEIPLVSTFTRTNSSSSPAMRSSGLARSEMPEGDLVLSYPGGEVRGLDALAEFLKSRLTTPSFSDGTEGSSAPDELASSISQTLANRRRKETRTPPSSQSRRSRSQSRTNTRSRAGSRTSRSRHHSPSSNHGSSRSSSPTRVDRNHQTPTTHNYVRRVVRNTAFFQSTSQGEELAGVPTALAAHPELVLGDLFYRRNGNKCQIWIWEREGSTRPSWKRVGWGYERHSDHKVLILSEKKALPSWVQKSHFIKHTQNHPDLRAMLVS